jgi:stage IV sporulation protein FB
MGTAMLVEPGQTTYDLRFRLFGTPVRVHPFFWLFSAILGWRVVDEQDGLLRLAIWIICCFLSVLLHEFGHVWTGALFGSRDSYIVLYSFGGLAVGSRDLARRWQRIAVSLAGPGIQLALYGLIWFTLRSADPASLGKIPLRALVMIAMLMEINLIWPLFNLLPVWPLDGGMVTRDVCTGITPSQGLRASLGLSIGVAAFIAVHSLVGQSKGGYRIPYLPVGTYAAILFGLLAYQSWQLLQHSRWIQPRVDERLPWEDDADAWKR